MNLSNPFLKEIFYTVVIPLVLFNVLDRYGDFTAMLVSSLPALFFVVMKWVKEKKFSFIGMMAIFSMFCFLAGSLLASWTGHEVLMELNFLPINIALCSAFIVSAWINRPLTVYIPKPGDPKANGPEEIDRILHNPVALGGYKIASYYWGIGILLIVFKEIALALILPLQQFVNVNNVTTYGMFGLLGVGTPVLAKYLKSRASQGKETL